MTRKLAIRGALLGLLALLLSACVGNPPVGLAPLAGDPPRPAQVQADPGVYQGREVRWGGEILSIDNQSSQTEVELYARPLFDNAEPRPDGGDGVRFLARVAGFLDPAQYSKGKRMTVRGRIGAAIRRPVGEYPYRYPVVEVERHHLWPVYVDPPEPAWFRDPYYDPWWPWGPWGPYRRWPYYW